MWSLKSLDWESLPPLNPNRNHGYWNYIGSEYAFWSLFRTEYSVFTCIYCSSSVHQFNSMEIGGAAPGLVLPPGAFEAPVEVAKLENQKCH